MIENIGKREQKKLQARNNIIEAAINQFGQQGFQQTSVADIMKAAHMGLGTFYNYFASKDELLHCLLDSLAVKLQQHLQMLEEKRESQAEILREMVMMTAELVGQNKYVLPLFLNAGERPEEAAAVHENANDRVHGPAFITMFLHLVKAGQRSGEFRQDMSAEIITEMFHSLFQAAAFSHLPLSFEENIKMKLRLMIDGICVK